MEEMISPPWVLAPVHGQEILDLLVELDEAEKEEREREKLKRREVKKQETAQRREAERQRKKFKPMEQSLPASPCGVLISSSVYNTPACSATAPLNSQSATFSHPPLPLML
ncbi:hypothetical protein M378DRAFT_19122 [Amanita muscaria Koide BX008]|uniref:Uncharacterized protein n=1 Tax=Amanita muscaria (strain Koide BX008) TaxID=946122 RepID=A0A0C2WCA9_AMAMK|nr:hypothetical protein M378DRAFT_19122 [Amanita muscaria Koide BX008]